MTTTTYTPAMTLASKANSEHRAAQAAARSALDHARSAGDLLIEAKALVDHGRWGAWLDEHVEFSAQTARLYMRIAERWPELEQQIDNALSIRKADELLRPPKVNDDFDCADDADPDLHRLLRLHAREAPVPWRHQAFMREPGRGGFVVVRPADLDGFFWITVLEDFGEDEGGSVRYNPRPVWGSVVDFWIDAAGFPVEAGAWIDAGEREPTDFNDFLFDSRDEQWTAERARWVRPGQ